MFQNAQRLIYQPLGFMPNKDRSIKIVKIFKLKIELINNVVSQEFEKAVLLGDANSKTLGFLPKMAFEKYAQANQLIGVFDIKTTELYGYLLYRISYNKVTIVHLCIDDNHRRKGVAKKLVNYLKVNTKKYQGIRLSCRNDYNINSVWEHFNFVPMYEKLGRSKAGLLLTIWWYPHKQADLFSQIADYELRNKISVVIDMNIFLDLKEGRKKESLALQSDWLSNEINLYVTREIYNEINKNPEIKTKESSRTFVSSFKEIPFDEDKYSEIFEELRKQICIHNKNDNSDLKHIAYAITGEAEYFVTRDSLIIENRELFSHYGINVYRPGHFISLLDEILQSSKYKPQNLIGTSINTENISSQNVDGLITDFLAKNGEKKNKLSEKIRTYLAYPKKFELITVLKNNATIAFMVFDRTEKNKLGVPVFRFHQNKLRDTLVKHLLYNIIQTATKEERSYIEITEKYLDESLIEIIQETNFLNYKNIWIKVNLKDVLTKQKVVEKLNSFLSDEDLINKLNLNRIEETDATRISADYKLERSLFPLKISDLDLPCFIVPIKPYWAEALFDDKSSQKLPLFEPDYPLLLNRENVYYRSSKPAKIKTPARILWWVSANTQTKQKGEIRACSYVDAVFVDNPKILFKRFEKLGVYKWAQIAKTAKNKDEIMAFVFSDTELLTKPISSVFIKDYFKKKENKNFMIVSPIEIKKETYIELYKKGMSL